MTPKKAVKRPGRVLYTLAVVFLKIFAFFRFGFVAPRGARKLKEPFLALCNHSSNYDFIFALLSLYPKRVNTLTAAFFFHNKHLARLLNAFHSIPREQFRADPASVRKMLSLIAGGGSVLLFPEGEVSGTGRTDVFPENTARLIKRCGVEVHAVHLYGSHMVRPKWALHERRGRVRAELSTLLTAEQVSAMSTEEILAAVHKSISHDEYRYQELARVPYRGKALAERLELLLYKCPRCQEEFTLTTESCRLFCTACGNEARMDVYGFLLPADDGCKVFRHVPDWVEYQRACLREEARDESFSLSAKTALQLHEDQSTLSHTTVGEGVVRLSRTELTYEGTRHGEAVSLSFPLSAIFKLPFSAGENFEVPNPTELIAFVPENRLMISKFVLAVPVLRELF